MKAFRIFAQKEARLVSMNEQDLTPGEVLIRVRYSGVNYKDALAGTGRGQILRKFPLNGGIDAAGEIESSSDPRFKTGQSVLINGCNTGETFDGGFAEKIRVAANSVVTKPNGLSLEETMILGTAGFTAALAIHRLEQNGQSPEQGPIVVTGASGGVGSFAVQLLALKRYEVWAITGKAESHSYLRDLGARQIMTARDLELSDRPLGAARFGGAIDNLGGPLLARLLAHTTLWGNIASIGLTESAELHTTVMPMILRGVSLLGISSNNCPMPLRQQIWNRLGSDWKLPHLAKVVARKISLADLPQAFADVLNRQVTGRIVVVM